MSKNREGELIHTYSPEAHEELILLMREAHAMARIMRDYFRKVPYMDPRYVTVESNAARNFGELAPRFKEMLRQMGSEDETF